jgi:hypothetical protein
VIPLSDFSNVHLTRKEIKLLKIFKNTDQINTADNLEIYEPLFYHKFIESIGPVITESAGVATGIGKSPKCKITRTGHEYLNYLKKDSRRFWIPTWISIVALIVAIAAIIVSVK